MVHTEVIRFADFTDGAALNEAILLLEDSSVPLRERVLRGISALSSMSDSAKRRLLPYLVSLAVALGPSFDLRSEIMSADPASVGILDGGGEVGTEDSVDVAVGTEDIGKESSARDFPVYGYNLILSRVSESWLRTAYLGSKPKAEERKRFESALSMAKSGTARIFQGWKEVGIHIRLTQDMYDAIVMMCLRAGVTAVRTSGFIQEVKKGRHLQASIGMAEVGGNLLGMADRARLVKKEAELYKSYLKAEISKKNSGVEVEVPKGYTVHGIDVSKYQGEIDFASVKKMNTKSGINIDFVFVKATRGKSTVDPRFSSNWASADKLNIARGAYHYFQPGVPGAAQARNFINTVRLEPGDLPPVLDWEEKADRSEALAWLKAVELHYGVRPIIYTGATFYRDNMGREFDGYPLWVSHGPFGKTSDLNIPGPAVSRKWSFWQFSDKARVQGIMGDVDLNVFNGNKAQLDKYRIKEKDEKTGDKSKPKAGSAKPRAKVKPRSRSAAGSRKRR